MRTILTSIALLALCACDAAEKIVTEPREVAGNVTNYVAEVVALPEHQRNAVFFRAIRDAGLPCQNVTGAEQIATGEKAPMWRAQCEDGVAHLIQVLPDGTANVVSRATP
ncbi:hypothetical protein OSJ57_07980 [Sphingomonas sp. HH69]